MARVVFALIGAAVGLALFFAVALLPAIDSGGLAPVASSGSLSVALRRATAGIRIAARSGELGGAPEVAGLCALAGAGAGAATSLLFTGGSRRRNSRGRRA